MIIEWNAHMFSREVERYPFYPKAAYTPDPSMLADDPLAVYLQRMRDEGIDRAVLVHPEPYGDDHRLILDCLAREPDLFKGVSLFFPRDPDAPRKLRDLVQREPRIVATRFHAHRGKEMHLDSFADAGVRALWREAADLGLIVELHIGPNYALQAADAIRDFPDTPVLIDHMGEPKYGTPVEFANILALARYPNVYMKLSGLEYVSTAPPLHLDIKPFTRLLADAFGPDRLVWGSGTPRLVDTHLDHLLEADRAQVKGANLMLLLSW
jgi:predicted TIM-barrel fold metal-dependent hydrolase